MCGRYRLSRRKQIVEEYFDCSSDEQDWVPRYNIAPTQPVPVIRQRPKEPVRKLSLMRWGLVSSWAKDLSGGEGLDDDHRSHTFGTDPETGRMVDECDVLLIFRFRCAAQQLTTEL
jgi:putative SOS response-associated peptidase YedK